MTIRYPCSLKQRGKQQHCAGDRHACVAAALFIILNAPPRDVGMSARLALVDHIMQHETLQLACSHDLQAGHRRASAALRQVVRILQELQFRRPLLQTVCCHGCLIHNYEDARGVAQNPAAGVCAGLTK